MTALARTARAAGLGVVLAVGWSSAAQAQLCFMGPDFGWIGQIATSKAAMMARTLLLGTNVSLARALTAENVISATKVFTKQVSADGARTQAMLRSTQEANAATLMEQARRERLVSIKEQYGYDTGQGVKACETVSMLAGVNTALGFTQDGASQAMTRLDVRPGAPSPGSDAVKVRLDPTTADASVLMQPGVSFDKKDKAIQQLAGMPPAKPTPQIAQTSEGAMMMLKARRIEALRSPALVSLEALRTQSDLSGHAFDPSNQSLVEYLDKIIDQYGGGPNHEAWAAGVAAQSESGLLRELARLRAMSLRLRQFQSEQQARLAAINAAMLAMEVGE